MCRHSLISDKQFGVGHSTSDVLTYIVQQLHNAIDEKQEARLICFDTSSAFYRVWHKSLTVKLESMGIQGKLLSWLVDHLKDTFLKVAINGIRSDAKSINTRVRQ